MKFVVPARPPARPFRLFNTRPFLVFILIASVAGCFAQSRNSARQLSSPAGAASGAIAYEVSGMYRFLRQGEFVQVTLQERGAVDGFIARTGDTGNDKGMVLDHFFESGSYNGSTLTFKTGVVHGTWFEFRGTVARGPVTTPAKEGYWVLKGALTQFRTDANGGTTSNLREVDLNSLPRDLEGAGSPPAR